MDELKKSEKELRARVIAKCNENFFKIRDDYNKLCNVEFKNTNNSVSQLFKKHCKISHNELGLQLSKILHTLDDKNKNIPQKKQSKNKLTEYSYLLEQIKTLKYKIHKDTLYTCTINPENTVNFKFNDYNDGFYNLVQDRSTYCNKEIYDVHKNYSSFVENYWKNVKNAPKDDLSILKDFKPEDIPLKMDLDEDFTVKNFDLSNLLGKEVTAIQDSNYFEDYYNFNNTKKMTINMDIQKQLRQVYFKNKHNENNVKDNYGLLVKGVNNDLVLKKDIEKQVNEFMVVFDDENMDVYPCESLDGYTTQQKHLQKLSISKFLTNDIVRLNLRNKVLLKLKRHENARLFTAKDMKNNSDKINKLISDLTTHCLWSDWNFFGVGMVPEISNEEIIQNPKQYLDSLGDNNLVLFAKTFLNLLDVRDKNLDNFENIFSIVFEIVSAYRKLVLEDFNEDYLEITKMSFLDLKTKTSSYDIGLSTPEGTSSSVSTLDHESLEIDTELHEQRLQLLPTFNQHAKTCDQLTDLRQLISFLATDFSSEPFVNILNLSKITNISKTVLYTAKNIKSKGKNTELEDTEVVLCALKLLDILVFILQKSNKSFNSSKDLQMFITNSKYHIDSNLASSLLNLFYERSNDTYSIKVFGSKRLMCYTIWLCIYLSPKYTFDFSTLLNIDLKGISNTILFSSCVELTSITVAGRTNKNLYKLVTPLPSTTKKINLTSLISTKTKRFKSR